MSTDVQTPSSPEHNITGIAYADRSHFRYTGPPLIDVHAHVTRTSSPKGEGDVASLEQAEQMLDVARTFGVGRIYTMCAAEDIPPLRDRFGDFLRFNGSIARTKSDEPEDAIFRRLDQFLELGVEMLKFWAAPRGRDRGLFVDAPWRIETARRAIAAGVRTIMVHVADPDPWFRLAYADATLYGTKADQYVGLERMLQMFPEVTWIAAHMGGDPEHPDHLEALLERYPHLYFDTSATKWQVREVSAHRAAVRGLVCRHPERFLFGSDLVTRPGLVRDHYVSRYWCQRTLWESVWEGRSPIADPDYWPEPGENPAPPLLGLGLPEDVLRQVYQGNAHRLFDRGGTT